MHETLKQIISELVMHLSTLDCTSKIIMVIFEARQKG